MSERLETGPDLAFQKHISDGHLWLQTCKSCSIAMFMPRILCPHCASRDLEWGPATGGGTIYSRAVTHRRPKPGQESPANQAIVLIDLDEGPRMMSHLPNTAAEDIHIGMRVRARIEGQEGERAVVFDPEEATA